ncbi:MAG: VCBS repeat-containing protein [Pirellulaceae bacterium]
MYALKLMACLAGSLFASTLFADSWQRHTIDQSLQGADGVRLADFNGDGRMDIVTGWEESGVVKLYLHPGNDKVATVWPSVVVGRGKSPEDAVAFDFDGDGLLEVVSCHEGKKKQVLVHRNAGSGGDSQLLGESNWKTDRIASLDGQSWMYATPIRLRDDTRAIVFGSKNAGASLTLLTPPTTDNRKLRDWLPIKLRHAGWIMSIETLDMDADGDEDIVFSDRKGKQRGVFWLEQPSNPSSDPWPEHSIGAIDKEVMFISVRRDRILASTRNGVWVDFVLSATSHWKATEHSNPPNVPFGKDVCRLDDDAILMTANTNADQVKLPRPGIWIKHADRDWQPIGTTASTKYDRMELVDIDGDGDLDVLTCEERRNLGVVWYENPGDAKQ